MRTRLWDTTASTALRPASPGFAAAAQRLTMACAACLARRVPRAGVTSGGAARN
jgi:hypothetical protein